MAICAHCGGEVDETGYRKMAQGGELQEIDEGEAIDYDGDEVARPDERAGHNPEDGFELEERQANEGESTSQQAMTELLRKGAFVDAIRNRRQSFAEGGEVLPGGVPAPRETPPPREPHLVGKMTIDDPGDMPRGAGHGKHAKKEEGLERRAYAAGGMVPSTSEQIAEMKRRKYGFGKGR